MTINSHRGEIGGIEDVHYAKIILTKCMLRYSPQSVDFECLENAAQNGDHGSEISHTAENSTDQQTVYLQK